MKYLEELEPGDSFIFEESTYIKLVDYKKNGDRCCANLKNGSTRWIESNTIVDASPLYSLDSDNNIVAIKETKKDV